MSGLLEPGVLVRASTIALEHEPLPAEQVVAGSPTTGMVVFVEGIAGTGTPEIGVWEMTPGTATDVEVDEVFVVIAGSATLELPDAEPIELSAGSVVQLVAGMATTWTVRETLRKIYVA